MNAAKDPRRLPRSLRKYLRRQKAELRRTLSEADARKAVDQLVRRVRQDSAPPSA